MKKLILILLIATGCATVQPSFEPYQRVVFKTQNNTFKFGYFYNYYKTNSAIIVSDTLFSDNTTLGEIKLSNLIIELKKKRIE